MAKGKSDRTKAQRNALIKMVTPVPAGPEEAAIGPAEEEPQYAFRTTVRCPRCGSTNTVNRATAGRIQYRMCRAPQCRYGDPTRGLGVWKVMGKPV